MDTLQILGLVGILAFGWFMTYRKVIKLEAVATGNSADINTIAEDVLQPLLYGSLPEQKASEPEGPSSENP